MNTAIDIEFNVKMSSKKVCTENFDQKFDIVFDIIDLPNLSLFEIISDVRLGICKETRGEKSHSTC